MIKGVEIVINRMKTHPEEFFGGSLKWHWLFDERTKSCLTAEEKEAIQAELDEVRRKEFTSKVMETLLEEKEPAYGYGAQEVMRLDSSGNLGIGTARSNGSFYYTNTSNAASNIMIGGTKLSESDFKALKALADREGSK